MSGRTYSKQLWSWNGPNRADIEGDMAISDSKAIAPYQLMTRSLAECSLDPRLQVRLCVCFVPQDDLQEPSSHSCIHWISRDGAGQPCMLVCWLFAATICVGASSVVFTVPVPITEASLASASAGGYARLKFARCKGPFICLSPADRLWSWLGGVVVIES